MTAYIWTRITYRRVWGPLWRVTEVTGPGQFDWKIRGAIHLWGNWFFMYEPREVSKQTLHF